MARSPEDSAILEIITTDDGYMMQVWKWGVSPPPVPFRDLFETTPPPTFLGSRSAATKADLKTKLGQFVDVVLGVG